MVRRSTATSRARPASEDLPRYAVGDEVIVTVSPEPEFGLHLGRRSLPGARPRPLLLGLFAVAVTVVGGWRGVRSLIALALTLAVVVKIVVPLILAGWDPVWVAIVAASAVTIATFLLTEGARRTDRRRLARHVRRPLALTALLAVSFDALAQFTDAARLGRRGYLRRRRHRRSTSADSSWRPSSSVRSASSTT